MPKNCGNPVLESLLQAIQLHLDRRAAGAFGWGAVLFSNQAEPLGRAGTAAAAAASEERQGTVHLMAQAGAPDLIHRRPRCRRCCKRRTAAIYAGDLVHQRCWLAVKLRHYISAEMTLERVLAVMRQMEAEHKTTVRLHTGPCLCRAIRSRWTRWTPTTLAKQLKISPERQRENHQDETVSEKRLSSEELKARKIAITADSSYY